ncbi:MAG TPA: hypothetical protein PLK41_07825 [Defluviitoga tunisiensis]|nr:hypothetical protein [Defluviitoga tunisiensis]
MKLMKCCLGIVILFLISGCSAIISLNPFYLKDDVTINDEILGKWKLIRSDEVDEEGQSIKDEETWTFKRDNETNSYELSVQFEDEEMIFCAVLFGIKDQLFLDLYPKINYPESNAESSKLIMQLLPTHTVSRITLDKDSMILEPLKSEWIKEKILRKKFELSYGVTENDIILLTAETEDIRAFLEDNIDEAFGEESGYLFKKVSEAP